MGIVLYRGWRIRALTWKIASGGFRSGALIWRDEDNSGLSQPVTLRGSWGSEEEALGHALDEGQRAVDAGLTRGEMGETSESCR
jgi:hypothetical protein